MVIGGGNTCGTMLNCYLLVIDVFLSGNDSGGARFAPQFLEDMPKVLFAVPALIPSIKTIPPLVLPSAIHANTSDSLGDKPKRRRAAAFGRVLSRAEEQQIRTRVVAQEAHDQSPATLV